MENEVRKQQQQASNQSKKGMLVKYILVYYAGITESFCR